jgi:hypothetical protein
MPIDASTTARAAKPATSVAEKRRGASDSARTSSIEATLKTGRPASMLWISRRIHGSSALAASVVRRATLGVRLRF